MKKTRLAVAVAAVALSAVAAVPAQGQVGLGLSAGISAPTGHYGEQLKGGYNVNGIIGVSAPLIPIGFRGEVGYNSWEGKSVLQGGNLDAISATANAVLQVPGMILAKPYLIGGLGWHRLKFDAADTGPAKNEMGWNFGGGVNFGVGLLKAMVEARYFSVKTPDLRLTYVPVTFGIMF